MNRIRPPRRPHTCRCYCCGRRTVSRGKCARCYLRQREWDDEQACLRALVYGG